MKKKLLILYLLLSLAFSQRIISTAPSITETIFLLGAQDHLVAVSKYCDYPQQAKSIENIGGYLDYNAERILLLKPDMVFLFNGNDNLQKFLAHNKISYKQFDNESISGILSMIQEVGNVVNKSEVAAGIVGKLKEKLYQHQKTFAPKPKIKVLVVIEQVLKGGNAQGLYILGKEKFYSILLEDTGFENVYKGNMRYPLVAPESLYSLQPEAIIVIEDGDVHSYESIKVSAIKNKKIFFLKDAVYKRPGPRFAEILDKFAQIRSQL